MRISAPRVLGLAACLMLAAPAYASGQDAEVPEANMVSLLSLAMAGVLIGRRMSSKRPPRD